jgi:hypothetical protein
LRRGLLLLVGLLSWLPGLPARAQVEGNDYNRRLNFAFASQLGSGIYDVSGRLIQIYRLPFSVTVRDVEKRTPGVEVTLPLCFGFYDLDQERLEHARMPEHVATVSFVPGVHLRFPVLRNWSLTPFVEFGVARDRHGPEDAYVYTVGVDSLATFHPKGLYLLLGHHLVYVGEHTPETEYDEDFITLQTGFEVRRPLALAVRGHGLNWGPYVMSYLYLEPTKVWLKEKPLEIGRQYEIGLTVGPRDRVDLWRFEAPRLGVGYRFGDGISAVRLVVGSAF